MAPTAPQIGDRITFPWGGYPTEGRIVGVTPLRTKTLFTVEFYLDVDDDEPYRTMVERDRFTLAGAA